MIKGSSVVTSHRVSCGRLARRTAASALVLLMCVAAVGAGGSPDRPSRPISYYADFGDDLIRTFLDHETGQFHPIDKAGLDRYFRRLQAQGVRRLIVWLTPFATIADPRDYSREDWSRYEQQARAILESADLSAAISRRRDLCSWGFIRQLMALRLTPDFGALLSNSAEQHGIRLTVSFRPFEAALTKYYSVPAFDLDGRYLWDFLPYASPALNYHPEEVGWAHYRTILRAMGQGPCGELDNIELTGGGNVEAFVARFRQRGDNLRIVARAYAPLAGDSFVLQRQADRSFRLCRYRQIARQAESWNRAIAGFSVAASDHGAVRVTGLRLPDQARFLLVSDPSGDKSSLRVSTQRPITLRSRTQHRLGRENVYWALDESLPDGPKTRVAGIAADGDARSEFAATEHSWQLVGKEAAWPLSKGTLVIDRGAPWSQEMIDFNRPAARQFALRQLRTVLRHRAFDEIFVNTRSHTQLAGYQGDGEDGIQTKTFYQARGKKQAHLGIDLAYACISASENPRLRTIAAGADAERITTWQRGEWRDTCQSPGSPAAWRYARNVTVAAGVRQLLAELERAFPERRIRVVLPARAPVFDAVRDQLDRMQSADGRPYGRDYYRFLESSLNHIPAVGEGMSMVDLAGLRVEPVFLGIRGLPDAGPLKLFLRHFLADMRDNHGSAFRGPRSFLYEAQETLRSSVRPKADRAREERICYLLSHTAEIGEIILYEAADWVYFLPLEDPHAYLDRSRQILEQGGWNKAGGP